MKIHSFGDDALGTHDAVGLASAIKAGDVSRKEVTDAAIARVELVNPTINALAVKCFDRARHQPRAIGAFSGVPSFVKDNVDVTGLPTRHGSRAIRPQPAKSDAPPAQQFLAQGFVLLGKTRLPEFGLTASTEYATEPPTCNPWNTDHSAGGSSGGSSAIVASGAVPIAHANDGGGSIRIPAAVNGLVGLKMTRNRLQNIPGVRELPVNLISEGVVSRSVRDTAHYLAAAERSHPEPTLQPVGLIEGPNDSRRRIGIIRTDIAGRSVAPDTLKALESAADTLAANGHEIVDTYFMFGPEFIADFKAYWASLALAQCAAQQAARLWRFDPRRLDPFTKGLVNVALRRPDRVLLGIRRLQVASRMHDRHFLDVDAILTPVLSHPAPRLGEHDSKLPFDDLFNKLVDYVGFTPFSNIGGGPAISVPHGLFSNNLPGSVQICAKIGDERTLLELAFELEATSPFPKIQQSADLT